MEVVISPGKMEQALSVALCSFAFQEFVPFAETTAYRGISLAVTNELRTKFLTETKINNCNALILSRL